MYRSTVDSSVIPPGEYCYRLVATTDGEVLVDDIERFGKDLREFSYGTEVKEVLCPYCSNRNATRSVSPVNFLRLYAASTALSNRWCALSSAGGMVSGSYKSASVVSGNGEIVVYKPC